MVKTASRKAAGELTPEAYPLRYVEDVGDPRTTREVVFSILLEARSPFGNSMRIPVKNLPLPACEKDKNKKEGQGVRNCALYGER